MKKFLFLTIIVLSLSGCMKLKQLQYLPQLLTLKAVSENGEEQDTYVHEYDEKFEEMLEIVKKGKITQFRDQDSFVERFGEPIMKKEVVREGVTQEKWLYRYATKFFGSEKVYLYFNENGSLNDWKYVKPEEE